jgi:hypothetical protein
MSLSFMPTHHANIRSEQEEAGYRDAQALIHESGKQMPFSAGTVQLRGILYRYMPQLGGHWKAANHDIVLTTGDKGWALAHSQ